MRPCKFSEQMIVKILHELKENPLDIICKKYSISRGTIYKWKAKYRNLSETDVHSLNVIEQKYRDLEEAYRKVCLENKILREAILGKL